MSRRVRNPNHASPWALTVLTVCIAIGSGCVSIPMYEPPDRGPSARLQIRTETLGSLTIWRYENAAVCSQPRQLGSYKGRQGSFDTRLPADSATAISLRFTGTAGLSVYSSQQIFRFRPRPDQHYRLFFEGNPATSGFRLVTVDAAGFESPVLLQELEPDSKLFEGAKHCAESGPIPDDLQ